MNPELTKKLYEKYPKIFAQKDLPMTQTCMCWGIECDDGWYRLLEILCEALTYTYRTGQTLNAEDAIKYAGRPGVKTYPDRPGQPGSGFTLFDVDCPQVIATQVKEKFGTLRFYFTTEYDALVVELLESKKYPKLREDMDRYQNYIDGVVHYAEIASGLTCEVTGQPGEMHVCGGWYRTINREHARTITDRRWVAVADLPKRPNAD